MANRQYESMTRVEVGGYVVRVWRSEPVLTQGPSAEVKGAIQRTNGGFFEIVQALDNLTNIAAFEILDKEGNGALVYPDWS